MIPVKSAIEEQAWLLIDNPDHTKMKFRFRPLELINVDPASIDLQDKITKVNISDQLWLLKMELVVLSKEPIETPGIDRPQVFDKYLLIKDGDGFSFKTIYEFYLCSAVDSNFAQQTGLRSYYRTQLFNPKIKYEVTILFELPDDVDNLYFAAAYGTISEA